MPHSTVLISRPQELNTKGRDSSTGCVTRSTAIIQVTIESTWKTTQREEGPLWRLYTEDEERNKRTHEARQPRTHFFLSPARKTGSFFREVLLALQKFFVVDNVKNNTERFL